MSQGTLHENLPAHILVCEQRILPIQIYRKSFTNRTLGVAIDPAADQGNFRVLIQEGYLQGKPLRSSKIVCIHAGDVFRLAFVETVVECRNNALMRLLQNFYTLVPFCPI